MKFLVAMLAISTTVAAACAVYLSANRAKLAPAPAALSPAVAASVAVADAPSAARRTPGQASELVGRLAAAGEVEVRASAGGFVLRARVDPGDRVEKGQTLIELENPTLEEAVRRAESSLDQAKRELETQQQRRQNAEQRREGLMGASLVGPRAGHGTIRMARSDEQQARARVTEAETALQKAKQALTDSQIVSPATGYVADRQIRVGDRVEPGMTVLRVTDTSTVKLVIDGAEGGAPQAVPASAREATITFDTLPERQFVGRVVRSLGGDGPTGRNTVSIEVANPDRLLKPGMSGRVRLFSNSYSESSFASSGSSSSLRRESHRTGDIANTSELLKDALVSLKGLATTLATAADTQTKALTQKQEATKITVEATTQYFGQLERQVVELRPDNASHHAVNLEKAADEIDNLPILHVDEELLTFGADMAQSLRTMAERRRTITRSRSYSDVTVSEEAQAENSAIRTQGMQRITIGLADMRRKMTKKYNLEFLANAANMRTASAQSRRRTTRH